MKPGTVYWLTGLSGAGKTTTGRALFDLLKPLNPSTIFLDGDEIRAAVAEDLGYSRADRELCARRYSRLCALLSKQGIDVIIATISMFRDVHTLNRREIPRYREIYLRVPMAVLRKRDPKGIYANGTEVVGAGVEVEEPEAPDLVLEGAGNISATELARLILIKFSEGDAG